MYIPEVKEIKVKIKEENEIGTLVDKEEVILKGYMEIKEGNKYSNTYIKEEYVGDIYVIDKTDKIHAKDTVRIEVNGKEYKVLGVERYNNIEWKYEYSLVNIGK